MVSLQCFQSVVVTISIESTAYINFISGTEQQHVGHKYALIILII